MPRAEAGTPKAIANAMKSKGLQRLRWYCQVCEKQCRDENGFKCHAQSEGHMRQMLVVGENAGRHISDFSSQFQSEFVTLLSRRFGTKRVLANRVYQEYIQDKHHLHMNSTRWVTLTEFCKHLGRLGIARVDENDKGWFIAWIDNSPKALAKQEASMKKERATVSDEQRERMLIAQQIERAKEERGDGAASGSGSGSGGEEDGEEKKTVDEGLKREEGEKVVLSFTAKLKPVVAEVAPAPLKFNAFKAASSNPLKRPNVFKASSKMPGADMATSSQLSKKRPISAAEQLIHEEQERKRRRMERETLSAA